jgi:hypothetical protein
MLSLRNSMKDTASQKSTVYSDESSSFCFIMSHSWGTGREGGREGGRGQVFETL